MYFVMPTVLSVFATIEVVSGRERLLRLSCTTTGGQTLKIRIEGPNNKASVESLQVKPRGDTERTGNDTYSATTGIIAGGNNGDIYQCTASNGVASDQTHVTVLKGTRYTVALSDWILHALQLPQALSWCH